MCLRLLVPQMLGARPYADRATGHREVGHRQPEAPAKVDRHFASAEVLEEENYGLF